MKTIESLEEAEVQIKEYVNKIINIAKYSYKKEIFCAEMIYRALDGSKPNPRFFARTSYLLGKGAASSNITEQLLYQALQCCLLAKMELFEDRIFYPHVASALRTADEILQMCQRLYEINLNY